MLRHVGILEKAQIEESEKSVTRLRPNRWTFYDYATVQALVTWPKVNVEH